MIQPPPDQIFLDEEYFKDDSGEYMKTPSQKAEERGVKFNVTIKDLRDLNPCFDPATKLGENWQGTLIDIIDFPDAKAEDKIWVVTKLLDEKTARLFACYCAQESLKYVKNETLKQKLQNTINASIRFANGEATDEERYAAYSAAYSAAWSAARYAADSAAESAAYSAAYSAAWSAADSAAESAARYAADSAAESAAYSAAYSAARYGQLAQLRKMILDNV